MSATSTFLATVLLTALSVHPASAQSPTLTNADVMRLVAMRVSDQTVIAVVREAKATQFDLSPRAVSDLAGSGVSAAVIATMRQSSTPSAGWLAVPERSPASGAQTLAGAAAQAAAQKAASPSMWRPALPIEGPSSPAVASTSEGAKSESTRATTTIVKDESYWKERMRVLQVQLENDTTSHAAAEAQLKGLRDVRADGSMAPVVADTVYKATAGVAQLLAAIQNDRNAIIALREEARRAGVPPGWVRYP